MDVKANKKNKVPNTKMLNDLRKCFQRGKNNH